VDVFAAVGFVVAIEQMLDAVDHAAPPRAINQIFHNAAILNHDAQQITQGRCRPITRNVGFCKTNVARFHAGQKYMPIAQTDGSVGHCTGAINFRAPIGELNGQGAVLDFFKQLKHTARGHGCRLDGHRCAGRRGGVHVQRDLEVKVEAT